MGISPTVAAIIAAGSAAASIGGTLLSASAQSSAARATQAANLQTQQAQQQAFTERMNAALSQTAQQQQAASDTMQARNIAASQMRESQIAAQQRQQDILAAENQQADALRAKGDEQARLLLDQTNADQLAAAQQRARDQASLLLNQNAPVSGPQPSDPRGTGDDPATKSATARRMAEAASNIRTYGAKVSALTAAGQPITDIGLAIAANKYGIAPAQQAESLLRGGSDTRLQPAQVAFRNAGDLGSAMDALLSSKGQSALDAASLSYGNKVAGANLLQSDLTQLAENKRLQAQADAQFKQSIGGIISGVGQLGLYGAGALGGPSLFGGSGGAGSAQQAIASGAVAPPGSFSYRGL